jgi:anti-anti-sigma regulatory factor
MMTADIKVTGRFDDAFAAGAKPMFERLAQEARDITVDMSEAVDVNAAGLGALVSLHKQLAPQGCKVRVLGANDNLQRLFERFQIADLFIDGATNTGGTALRSCFFGLSPVAVITGGAAAAVKKAGPGGSHGGAPKRAVPIVTRFDAASHSVKVWLDAATTSGGEIRGCDAMKSYRRWAKKMCQDADPDEFRRNLAGIIGAGCIVPRTSGYVVRGIQLRGAIESGRKRLASAVRASGSLFAGRPRMDAIAALSF